MSATDKADIRVAILAAIDRHGGDLSRWPDRRLAIAAGEAVLADRGVRARLDDARALDAGLDAVRDAIDAEIAASGALGRISAATRAGLGAPRLGRLGWVAAAVMIVGAAALGGMVDLTVADDAASAPVNVVVLDPLVFGPMTGED